MSLEPQYIENPYCVTNSDNHWCTIERSQEVIIIRELLELSVVH